MSRPAADHVPEYCEKTGRVITHFQQRPFRYQDRFSSEYVTTVLLEMQKQLLMEHLFGKEKTKKLKTTEALSRRDAVNKKRDFIKKVIQNRATRNIAELARATKSDRSTVKSLMRDLDRCGEVSKYEYNNLKSEADLQALERTIEQARKGFLTVS